VSQATVRRSRQRLDQLVVERGLAETRARAQALILAGKVRTGTGDAARLDRKAGDLVDAAVAISLVEADPYVSRGGHKLAAALDAFAIDPRGLVCLDAGASTGGFTDVLLQRGAARVHAVDVGRGQLADRVARDPRVVVHDRTNARTHTPDTLGEAIELAVIDVSFISLALLLGPIAATLRPAPSAPIVALVKPQFEVGKGGTDHGVVRDPEAHRTVLRRIVDTAASIGLGTRAVIASPILGPEGNREFLVHLQSGPSCAEIGERIDEAVDGAGIGGEAATADSDAQPGTSAS
jgi:23S rRNA (cytidine1920-2'-O)/16S rRNA (cytidine1409-2'-O)-methyltransferase